MSGQESCPSRGKGEVRKLPEQEGQQSGRKAKEEEPPQEGTGRRCRRRYNCNRAAVSGGTCTEAILQLCKNLHTDPNSPVLLCCLTRGTEYKMRAVRGLETRGRGGQEGS